MTVNSYAREIVVSNTPSAVFRALTTEFDCWWTASSRPIVRVSDTVTFSFAPTYWRMRVIKLRTNECVELQCIEAHHIHQGLPESIRKEWEGTTLKWAIQQDKDHTIIRFVHEGLLPALHCYQICEEGWDHFFVDSLKNYLER